MSKVLTDEELIDIFAQIGELAHEAGMKVLVLDNEGLIIGTPQFIQDALTLYEHTDYSVEEWEFQKLQGNEELH
jgi:hypothetical protein